MFYPFGQSGDKFSSKTQKKGLNTFGDLSGKLGLILFKKGVFGGEKSRTGVYPWRKKLKSLHPGECKICALGLTRKSNFIPNSYRKKTKFASPFL